MMPAESAPSLSAVEWGVAGRPFPGEIESGDLHVVAPFEGGVLVAAIDGLGHGVEAAQAARRAADALSAAPGQPVHQLVERCHAALRSSRGAVMTLATLDTRSDLLTWTAVGNVEATLCRVAEGGSRTRESVVPRGGVVGYQLPTLREVTLPLVRGDVLVFATDGIGHDFILDSPAQTSAQDYASYLLGRYATGADDALVLVVRYLGRSS
jgi:hypothetical protein